MIKFLEKIYSPLQYKIEHCSLFGTQVGLDDGVMTLLAAYFIGVNDAMLGEIDEIDLERSGLELDID